MKIKLHLFIIFITLLFCTNTAWAQEGLWTDDGNYASAFMGSGKANDPYLINDAKDLARLAYFVNAGTADDANRFKGKYFVQTQDIDLSAHFWKAIGLDSNIYFAGSYDGKGHSITGLTIEEDKQSAYKGTAGTGAGFGLFGSVGNGGATQCVIQNIVLLHGSITLSNVGGERVRVGMFVGALAKNCELRNCSAIGCNIKVSSNSNNTDNHIAGLVGDVASTFGGYAATNYVIDNCYSGVNIELNNSNATNISQTEACGMVGRLRTVTSGSVLPTNCMYRGTITGKNCIISPVFGTCRGSSSRTTGLENKNANLLYVGRDQASLPVDGLYFSDYIIKSMDNDGTTITKTATELEIETENESGRTYRAIKRWNSSAFDPAMVQGVNVGEQKSLEEMLTIFNGNVTEGNKYVTWYKIDGGLRPAAMTLAYDSEAKQAHLIAVGPEYYVKWFFNGVEITDASGVGETTCTLTTDQAETVDGKLEAKVYTSESDETPLSSFEKIINATPAPASIKELTLTTTLTTNEQPDYITNQVAKVTIPEGYENVAPILYYQWKINGEVVKEGVNLQTYELTAENKAALNAELSVNVYRNKADAENNENELTRSGTEALVQPFNDNPDYFSLVAKDAAVTKLEVMEQNGVPAVLADVFATTPLCAQYYDVSFEWKRGSEEIPYIGNECDAATNALYTWTLTLTPKDGQPAYFQKAVFTCSYRKGIVVFIDPENKYGNADDTNDGLSAETPVKNMWRAYEVLRVKNAENGMVNPAMEENTIVLMSDYASSIDNRTAKDQKDKNNGVQTEYFGYYKNRAAFWAGFEQGVKKLCNDVNCTITGKFAGKDYGPTFKMPNDGNNGIYLSADTKFEYLKFGAAVITTGNEYGIFACGNNLTLGCGLTMDIGLSNADNKYDEGVDTHFYGKDGWRACRFEVTMGFNVPAVAWGKPDAAGNYASPEENGYFYKDKDNKKQVYHGFDPEHPATLIIQSGCVGRVLGNSRSTTVKTDGTRPDERVFASKKNPFYVNVIVDVSKEEKSRREAKGQQSDVGFLILGQADGTCFSNATLTLKSGRVGRVVGGNLGWSESSTTTPRNSYFGTTEINIEEDIVIDELYGGTLGRAGATADVMAYPAYYGHININMNGGTVNKLFAVGAGGLTGYSPKSSDPFRETWAKVIMNDDSTDVHINMTGGTIGEALYGGGYGQSNILKSTQHPRDAGALYGNSYVNITGGIIKGYVYAAGSGANGLKGQKNMAGESLNSIAQLYGNTRLTIGGKAEIQGGVYGGGMGIEGAPEMAHLFGTSEVHIQDDAKIDGSVYGGGALSSITGSTGVYITGNPTIKMNVFGGGQGSTTQQAKIVASADINGGESVSKVYVSGGRFVYQDNALTTAKNCIFGGGDVNCFVNKSDVRVTASMVPVVLNVSETQYATLTNDIRNARFHLFGGGLGKLTHTDDTNVFLDLPITPRYPSGERGYINVFGGGFEGTATTTHVQIGNTDNPFNHVNNLRYVFGGGFNANVGTGKTTTNASGTTTYTNLTGETNVSIFNANADVLYGGGYLGEVWGDTHLNIHGAHFASAYGGGEAASVRGNATTVLNRVIKSAPAGSDEADEFSPVDIHYNEAIFGGGHGTYLHPADVNGTATTKVYGCYYEYVASDATSKTSDVPLYSIYGGCNYHGTVGNTDVYIHIPIAAEAHTFTNALGLEETEALQAMDDVEWEQYYETDNESTFANVYGAGFGAQTTVSGNTRVVIPQIGANNYKDIYGGGEQGVVKGNTFVEIGVSGKRYASNADPYDPARLASHRLRNVYGGGLKADVEGSTDVCLYSGHARTIVGGGMSGNIGGNTTIRTERPNTEETTGTLDLTLMGSIYGGCVLANVGKADVPNTGHTTIRLEGGVRLVAKELSDGTRRGGIVYGGGRGLLGVDDDSQTQSADIVRSDVLIAGPDTEDATWRVVVDGDVYGGGNLACHALSSNVRIKGVYGDVQYDVKDVVSETQTGEGDGLTVNNERRNTLWTNRLTNVYGGGLGIHTSTNNTYVSIGELGQTATTLVGNVFGGGEGGDIGNLASTAPGYPYTDFTKGQTSTANTTQANLGQTQVYVLPGSLIGLNLYGGCNKSSVYGHTRVSMLGGTIGTDETVLADYGNYFGGSNTGYVYGNTTAVVGRSFYKKNGDFYTFLSPEEFNALPEASKSGYVDCDFQENGGAQNALVYYCSEITIKNALFGGGNIAAGITADDKKVYANTETVLGNSHIYITDDEQSDYIVISSDGTGGLYGDGNLVLTRGHRDVYLTSYGSQYHTLPSDLTREEYDQLNDRVKAYYNLMYKHTGEDKYITDDEYKKLSESEKGLYTLTNHCQLKAGRMLNTLQRADHVTLRNTRMVMLGAPDKVPEVVDYTNYSVNRVDSVTNISKSDPFFVKDNKGNFFGIYNVTNLLGSMQSDILMTDPRKDDKGDETGESYYDYKSNNKLKPIRNRGTSPNEVAIANGAWLVIEHMKASGEGREYGRVDGVYQLSLLASSTGEGGGYVYAKNIHGENEAHESLQDGGQIETSGNFVHPTIHVVDDCFPNTGDVTAEGHYWFLKGSIYVYNVKVSSFTGTAQAYKVDIMLPMVQLDAAMAGRLRVANIQDNYYCIVAGEYNNKTYELNQPIDAYEYGKLQDADRANFARMTYVKKTADFEHLKASDVITSTAYDLLSDTEKENYYITNSISTQTGFALTAHLDNPKEFTYQVQNKGTAKEQEVEPMFIFRGTEEIVLGQRSYNVGTFHPSGITALKDGVPSEGDDKAVFEKAYITKASIEENYYDAAGKLIQFMQPGAGVGQTQYDVNAGKDPSLNEQVEPAYICTQTLKLSDTKIYPTGDVIGQTELNALKAQDEAYGGYFTDAVICTRSGDWGGTLFKPGVAYTVAEYSDISQAERDTYQFDYNFGQLNMLDLQRPYDFKYTNLTDDDAKPNYSGHTNCYDQDRLINFTATCRENFASIGGKSYVKGQVAREEEFDALVNEKNHFYLCYFTTAGTQYVCNAPRLAEGQGNSIGTVIDHAAYGALPAEEQARYMAHSVDMAGTYAFTTDEGGFTSKAGYHFAPNTLYSNKSADYTNLVDEKQYFKLTGINPTAAFNFYVSRDATYNTLRTNRIVTLELQYKYEEYDADAGGYTPVTERYIVNVELEFKSGAPTIGNIAPLPKVIPGSTISFQQPLLTQGAYVIESTGWEMSLYEDFRTFKECTPNTPVFWYEDGYYVRFYAITYLGKAASSPTRIKVANYHRMNDVLTRKDNLYIVKNANIFIDGAKELQQFHDYFDKCATDATFYNQRDDLGNIFNPQNCADVNFHMQNNVDMNDWATFAGTATWTPVGSADHPFQGNFNGNGACLRHLVVEETTGQPAGFFGQIKGGIIRNLGVHGTVKGSGEFVGGIVGCTDKLEESLLKMENCWYKGDVQGSAATKHRGAIMGGAVDGSQAPQFFNCYYNGDVSNTGRLDTDVRGYDNGGPKKDDANTEHPDTHTKSVSYKTRRQFVDGKVAYFLNGYYLNRRNDVFIGGEGCLRHEHSYQYVRDSIFYEHDNYPCEPWDWTFIRTYHESGQYNSGLPYYDETKNHGKEGREPYYVASNVEAYNEYIMFGQHIDIPDEPTVQPGGDKLPGICNYPYTHCRNGVYRATAYRGTKQPEGYYYNLDARVWEDNITALDFTAYADQGVDYWDADGYFKDANYLNSDNNLFFPPLNDSAPLESFKAYQQRGLSKNLLVYVSSVRKNAAGKTGYDVVKTGLNYTEASPAYRISGHTVAHDRDVTYDRKATGPSGTYTAALLHLVDDESFNAPIAFTAEKAWYDYQPTAYVKAGNDAWQSFALPFTATSVEAYVPNANGDMTHANAATTDHGFSFTAAVTGLPSYGNGAMTHFYGAANTNYDNLNNGVNGSIGGAVTPHNVGHQYWLRTADEQKADTVFFSRPTEYDALSKKYAKEPTFTYQPTCEWYWQGAKTKPAEGYTLTAYPLVTAHLPYIVSFPGKRYYEFDLSGAYAKVDVVGPQAVTFAAPSAEILVTDDYVFTQPVAEGVLFTPNFLKRPVLQSPSEQEMVMNAFGTAFEAAVDTVHPFRAVLTVPKAAAPADHRTSPRAVYIGQTKSAIADALLPGAPADEASDADATPRFALQVVGRQVIVTSPTPLQLPLYTASGVLRARWSIAEGKNVFTIPEPGIYILGTQKLLIR